MVRFFIKTTTTRCGATRITYSSIDGDLDALERALTSGGYGESECEFSELVGAEACEGGRDHG